MSEQQTTNEAACGGSALTAELGAELPGKRARAMLPLLEEIAERDAEIERLRAALTDALEVGSHLMSAASYERARRLVSN